MGLQAALVQPSDELSVLALSACSGTCKAGVLQVAATDRQPELPHRNSLRVLPTTRYLISPRLMRALAAASSRRLRLASLSPTFCRSPYQHGQGGTSHCIHGVLSPACLCRHVLPVRQTDRYGALVQRASKTPVRTCSGQHVAACMQVRTGACPLDEAPMLTLYAEP